MTSAAEMQLCKVTNMYRTCELKLSECGQSEETVWLCVTDLWCIAWVMMFTAPFHHLSPNNTWNSRNYISLAILCKIFTFSFLTLTPPSLHPMRLVVLVCARAQKGIWVPSLGWSWKEAGVREASLSGRMRVHLNVSILLRNVLLSFPSFQRV